MLQQPRLEARIRHRLPFRSEDYILTLLLPEQALLFLQQQQQQQQGVSQQPPASPRGVGSAASHGPNRRATPALPASLRLPRTAMTGAAGAAHAGSVAADGMAPGAAADGMAAGAAGGTAEGSAAWALPLLGDRPHKLQEWFAAAGPCLLLVPDSYSGRVLDSQVGGPRYAVAR